MITVGEGRSQEPGVRSQEPGVRSQKTEDRRQNVGIGDNGIVAEAITRDPETMHGTPVFRGTRVPVQNLFDYL